MFRRKRPALAAHSCTTAAAATPAAPAVLLLLFLSLLLINVQVYDPSTTCWQSLPDMQQPRYAHAVTTLAGRVYALGGQATKAIHRCTWRCLAIMMKNNISLFV